MVKDAKHDVADRHGAERATRGGRMEFQNGAGDLLQVPGAQAARPTPTELDERAFKKLNRPLTRATEQALAIAAESARRQGEHSSEVFPTELAVLYFKRGQPGPR
jgi:hypothetical protein